MPVFRAPANIQLRRAQITLMLATLVPTVLMTAVGIVLLAIGSDAKSIVSGVLVLAFCTTSLTGYILGSIFVSRGASVARFQNDFLSSVSHELRTPLTSIGMFIETLRDERVTDPNERQHCLALMHREIHRLQSLVERLSSLSRIESGGQNIFDKKLWSLREITDDALLAFQTATLNDAPQSVITKVPGDLFILADREAMAQVLSNLLVNAWKYTPSGSRRIEVSAEKRGGQDVVISVKDNGPGIPKDEQKKVLEHFGRGRRAIDENVPGSGLGLAIVKAIVRAHQGKMTIDSKPGLGSTFSVTMRAAS